MASRPQVIGVCFFCGEPVLSEGLWASREWMEEIQKEYGKIPERVDGTIGNKPVCKACRRDLRALVASEDY